MGVFFLFLLFLLLFLVYFGGWDLICEVFIGLSIGQVWVDIQCVVGIGIDIVVELLVQVCDIDCVQISNQNVCMMCKLVQGYLMLVNYIILYRQFCDFDYQ